MAIKLFIVYYVCMKYFLSILFVTILISLPNISNAQLMPFGGQVVTVQPCNTGLLLYVKTPLMGVLPYMWLTGNLPYLMNVPPHPGQYLLGMSGAILPCILGIVPIGAGPVILYHGSSL
jgi:hypothetical protein